MISDPALVAQGIEHRPPEPGAQVRILPRAQRNPLVRGGFPRSRAPPEGPWRAHRPRTRPRVRALVRSSHGGVITRGHDVPLGGASHEHRHLLVRGRYRRRDSGHLFRSHRGVGAVLSRFPPGLRRVPPCPADEFIVDAGATSQRAPERVANHGVSASSIRCTATPYSASSNSLSAPSLRRAPMNAVSTYGKLATAHLSQ